jgi:hypothetical protein
MVLEYSLVKIAVNGVRAVSVTRTSGDKRVLVDVPRASRADACVQCCYVLFLPTNFAEPVDYYIFINTYGPYGYELRLEDFRPNIS